MAQNLRWLFFIMMGINIQIEKDFQKTQETYQEILERLAKA